MDQHLKQGYPDLPVVVPILYYRGKVTPYPYKGDIFDCFGKNNALAEKIYLRPYPIIDIASMSEFCSKILSPQSRYSRLGGKYSGRARKGVPDR